MTRQLPTATVEWAVRLAQDHPDKPSHGAFCMTQAEIRAFAAQHLPERFTALDIINCPALGTIDACYAACHLLPVDLGGHPNGCGWYLASKPWTDKAKPFLRLALLEYQQEAKE